MCVFIAGHAWGWGPMPWLVCSEIQPLHTRAAGTALATQVNFLLSFLIGQCFLTMLCSMRYGVFLFFAGRVSAGTHRCPRGPMLCAAAHDLKYRSQHTADTLISRNCSAVVFVCGPYPFWHPPFPTSAAASSLCRLARLHGRVHQAACARDQGRAH